MRGEDFVEDVKQEKVNSEETDFEETEIEHENIEQEEEISEEIPLSQQETVREMQEPFIK